MSKMTGRKEAPLTLSEDAVAKIIPNELQAGLISIVKEDPHYDDKLIEMAEEFDQREETELAAIREQFSDIAPDPWLEEKSIDHHEVNLGMDVGANSLQIASAVDSCVQIGDEDEDVHGFKNKKKDDNLCPICNVEFQNALKCLLHYREKHKKVKVETENVLTDTVVSTTELSEDQFNSTSIALSTTEQLPSQNPNPDTNEIQNDSNTPAVFECKSAQLLATCGTCKTIFLSDQHLLDHVVVEHPDLNLKCANALPYLKGVFCCEQCGSFFPQLSHLVRHKLSLRDLNTFQCMVCRRLFYTARTLTRHYYNVHMDQGIISVADKLVTHQVCQQYKLCFTDAQKHEQFHALVEGILANSFRNSSYYGTIHSFYKSLSEPFYQYYATSCPENCVPDALMSCSGRIALSVTNAPIAMDEDEDVDVDEGNESGPARVSGTSQAFTKKKACYSCSRHEAKNYLILSPPEWFCLWKCSDCGIENSSDIELLEHWDLCHETVYACRFNKCLRVPLSKHECYRYYCEHCDQAFASLKNLILHKLWERNLKFTTCEICDDTTADGVTLLDHYLRIHTTQCLITFRDTGLKFGGCGAQVKTIPRNQTNLYDYKARLYKFYICDNSGKIYFLKSEPNHGRFVSYEELPSFQIYVQHVLCDVMCNICLIRVNSMSELVAHVKGTHTPLDVSDDTASKRVSQTEHACTLCDCIFSAKHALEKHLLTHYGVKPYVCTVCKKHFYSSRQQCENHHQKSYNNIFF